MTSDKSDGIIISTSGFSLEVYQVNFCKLEKTDFAAADVNGYETRTYR